MKNYKVSVIVPFHNVRMDMFEKAYKSLTTQTIGFDNIQLIVIVHNCEPQYMPQLQQMLSGHENVLVKELNNEAKTPSSPRNYGLSFATAPYIAFLDADDSLLPKCLEVTYHEALDTESQVVTYRRDYELENGSLIPVTDKQEWNQTVKRVIIERDKIYDKKMFTGSFGFVTSRLFERKFLVDKKILFDETIPFGEDIYFIINSLSQADRLCFLPQFIGYHYYINGESLVQNHQRSGKMIVSYAKGFKKFFDLGLNFGIDMQECEQEMTAGIASFILRSQQTTLEDRQEIKDIFEPYIRTFKELPPNKKYTAERREIIWKMAHEVILNPENPYANTFVMDMLDGMSELMAILHSNADTDYGQAHNFSVISTLKGYQYRTPLTHYSDYEPYIDLQTRVGEGGIIVQDKIDRYFELPDGKLLPSTQHHFTPYAEAFASMLRGHHNLLMATSLPVSRKTNDGAEVDTLESMLVKDYFFHFFYVGGKQQASFSAPFTSFFLQQQQKDFYDIMYNALADSDIDQIAAVTTRQVVAAFKTLEQQWPQMVVQLRADGKTDRADEVETILREGFKTPIALRLWPKLNHIVAFGAGELYESCQEMKRYTGSIAHNHGFYFTEEAIFGKAVEDGSNLFECIRGNNFYELIPIKGDDNSDPVKFSEATIGEPYQLVVTNRAGLYRYVTDHIICPKVINQMNVQFTIY